MYMARKTSQVHIVVDERTREAWERAAEESGLTLSAWVRTRCNGVRIEAAEPKLKRAA
jgi:hypothetical protein